MYEKTRNSKWFCPKINQSEKYKGKVEKRKKNVCAIQDTEFLKTLKTFQMVITVNLNSPYTCPHKHIKDLSTINKHTTL